MTTDDKQTHDPTPALLSAARLDEIRERVSYTVIAEAHSEAIADRAALLRHLDALQAPAVEDGGKALGRGLFFALHPSGDLVWKHYEDESKAPWIAAALALDAHGYARGVAAGEAERAELRAMLADTNREQGRASAALVAANEEIARLTAELAEAQADLKGQMQETIEARQLLRAQAETMRDEQEAAVATARIEGAREERAALSIRFEQLSRLEHDRGDRCAASETDADEAPLHYAAHDAFGAAATLVRARGEDRPPCPGEGWEWDAFALQWFQPGAKGKAIATSRARGEGQGS